MTLTRLYRRCTLGVPMIRGLRRWSLVGFLFVAPATISLPCFAQAWVDPKGETSVSLTYQFSNFLGHSDVHGKAHPENGSQAQIVTLELEHSLTDRLAVSFSVPYLAARFCCNPAPGFPRTGINDGHYHATWQDYHFELRYNVLEKPLVVTPSLAFVIPSHHYQTIRAEAVGRDLREAHIGVDVGRLLDPLFTKAYVDAHLAYVFSEKALGISTNRTAADGAVGYFVTPRFTARVIAAYQKTHGGLTSDDIFGGQLTPELQLGHDRLVRNNYLRAGFAGSFAVSPLVDLYAGYVKNLWGTDTHYGYGISAGVSHTFPARR